jgi:hypothetical protein
LGCTDPQETQPAHILPSQRCLEAIINHTSTNFAVIFKILSETAIEGHELHIIPINQIDAKQGKISVVGTKRHDNGIYTLRDDTAEMLRQYLTRPKSKRPKIQENELKTSLYPFPTRKTMTQMWVKARTKASKKLCRPELNKIQMKVLRNYAGAIFYLTFKDPIQTMQFMRHKKLEQTMDYLRGLKEFTAHTTKVTKIATTPEEASDLLNQGFKEESVFGTGTPNEKHLFTKNKY